MEYSETFQYEPRCSWPECARPAVFKVAAPWSSGAFAELKNYGTCCDQHRTELLKHARHVRKAYRPAAEEALGEIGLYQLLPGVRDAELTRVADSGI